MRYTSWVRALLGACAVIKNGGQYDSHLGLSPKLEIIKKRRRLRTFDARHLKYDKLKHFAAFCEQFVLLSPKKVKNTHFYPKMAWSPATYDVISRNNSNCFSPNLCQNVSKWYAYSYWKRQVLMKNRLGKHHEKPYWAGGGHLPAFYVRGLMVNYTRSKRSSGNCFPFKFRRPAS